MCFAGACLPGGIDLQIEIIISDLVILIQTAVTVRRESFLAIMVD